MAENTSKRTAATVASTVATDPEQGPHRLGGVANRNIEPAQESDEKTVTLKAPGGTKVTAESRLSDKLKARGLK